MKKKRNFYLGVFLIMALAMVLFVAFALRNPQASFPWPLGLTYGLYLVYIGLMGFCLTAYFKNK